MVLGLVVMPTSHILLELSLFIYPQLLKFVKLEVILKGTRSTFRLLSCLLNVFFSVGYKKNY